MTELEKLVTEWRDAREAILRVDWGNPENAGPAGNRRLVPHWERLGHAEAALMAHARRLS